jgi:hypothetical protein
MAIRVFGFRSISSRGSTTLGAPTGNIFLNSTGTNITGNASVAGYVYALGSGTFLRNFFVLTLFAYRLALPMMRQRYLSVL